MTNNAINVGVVAGGGQTYTFPAATDTLVGRDSTDTLTNKTLVTPALGTPSALVLTNATGLPTAGLVDDAVSLAKMAAGTAGNLITYDASGNPAAVATGTAGQVLTSNGAGAAPTMQTPGGGEWTYVSKLTFSNSSTQQNFTSLAAHDYYRLVFNIYNHGARLTMNVGVNGIAGTAYLYFYMALTPYVNNNQAAWKIYDTGATANDVFTGDYIIGAKYLTASNMKSIAGVGSGGNTNATILNSGRITGDAADVSSIEIKPTNAISGTVELWYKDKK